MGARAAAAATNGVHLRRSATARALGALGAALASILLISPQAANADYLAIEVCDPAPDCERIGQVDLPHGASNPPAGAALTAGTIACDALVGPKAGPKLGAQAEAGGGADGGPGADAGEEAWLALCGEPDTFGDPVFGAYRHERDVAAARIGDLDVRHAQGSSLSFVYTTSWADTQIGDRTIRLRLVPRHWSEPSPFPPIVGG